MDIIGIVHLRKNEESQVYPVRKKKEDIESIKNLFNKI